MFKFIRTKDKFKWESKSLVLEFSEPSIQGFDDYIQMSDIDDVMYYYYTVKIFKKTQDRNGNAKFVLIGKRRIHDFPCMKQLKYLLEHILSDYDFKTGQSNLYSDDETYYTTTLQTCGFVCEDFYEISRTVDSEGNNETFTFYCGVTYDTQGDLNNVGIRTEYVDRSSLIELQKCITEFISYSLKCHNKEILSWKANLELEHGKLYEYSNDGVLEHIYAIGDNVDITTVVDNNQYRYSNFSITKIENGIIYSLGVQVNIDTIYFISNNISNELLSYNEEQVADEFISILADEEKAYFLCTENETILNKYNDVIIGRTKMCRDEHNFQYTSTGNPTEDIKPIVLNVIKIIKQMLSFE